ncbi:GAF domain-containing protein [Niastella sp. OAS944]|uniref:GAF domain-containing protein n=1 Tax=Niastella sp. OAS944 TaxID=2664089 RepID=UPI0034933E81|nr:GAF domain-containing protein [Chitinophagaceae bacterium OAS944]
MNDMIMRIVDAAVQNSMQMLQDGAPQNKILAGLVGAAERLAGGGAVSSILLLDKEGLLRNGASPQLPHDYLRAIDGLRPHPKVGTCAAAAATGNMVVTLDFMADDKWAELRHLPTALGFTGAWSMPIKNAEGKVLGTFGTYFREKREPSSVEIAGIKQLADAAAGIVS